MLSQMVSCPFPSNVQDGVVGRTLLVEIFAETYMLAKSGDSPRDAG